LNQKPDDDEWAVWGRWFLADPSTRTISPFSKQTVPEYIEDRIKEDSVQSLNEAARLVVGNDPLLKRIAAARSAENERLETDRARNSIKQWLVLAPIALETNQIGLVALDIEQIEAERKLRPKNGVVNSTVGGDLKWREVALTNEVIDFNAILGKVTKHSVAYAVCYIRSEAGRHGIQMLMGSDDEAKVYLNEKEVHKSFFPREFLAEQDTVPNIALNAGLNVLVFKVVNEENNWRGSMRLTDAQGDPLKGIKVTLDPDAKDSP
jgi:hypothetical protein